MDVTGQKHKRGKYILKMVLKARVGNDPVQLDSTEAGVICSYFLINQPGPLDLSLPHEHRHPVDDGAENIIIYQKP